RGGAGAARRRPDARQAGHRVDVQVEGGPSPVQHRRRGRVLTPKRRGAAAEAPPAADDARRPGGAVAADLAAVVNAPILQLYPDLVRELGGDPTGFLLQVGLD